MPFNLVSKPTQISYELNEGEIYVNKPLGFPKDRGHIKPYSCIFNIMNASTEEGTTLEEHAHQGFELLIYVVRGTVDYFDTINQEWERLNQGDIQLIKSASGMKHTQRWHPNTQIFEIWFNPDMRHTILNEPQVINHRADEFPEWEANKMRIKTIIGSGSELELDTEEIKIKELTFFHGNHSLNLEPTEIYSAYMLRGGLEINNTILDEDDFMIITNESSLEITAGRESRLLVIESPKETHYKTYAKLYPQKYF
jgi:redox-sensitive bicupin YhaK (pirin superfamily)